MYLFELFGNAEAEKDHRVEKDDQTTLSLSDLRKTKLTLSQLYRLRILNDIRKIEFSKKLEKVKNQYKPMATDQSMM